MVKSLENCDCGRAHETDVRAVYCGPNITAEAGRILKSENFPTSLLLVADQNTLRASRGLLPALRASGFLVKQQVFEDMRTADMEDVDLVASLSAGLDAILSVGSGSLNDICRLAAFKADKAFAIYATAPSMDGFASDSAPITTGNFKFSHPAKQPSVIMADTKVLAASPAELKAAGFGDMIGKFIGLADWRISNLLTGEYYCPKIAALTEEALRRLLPLAHKVQDNDEKTAGEIFEALVLTGLAMGFAKSVRPASGAEHVISHFWEVKKLQEGKLSDFHGKKVGLATLLLNKMYLQAAGVSQIKPQPENLDMDEILSVYGEGLTDDVIKANTPSVTQGITPELLSEHWEDIRNILLKTLPPQDELVRLMQSAGLPLRVEEIAVDRDLRDKAIRYSPFMRQRLTLLRLWPMLGFEYGID